MWYILVDGTMYEDPDGNNKFHRYETDSIVNILESYGYHVKVYEA